MYQIVVLCGEYGSGKSTVAGMLKNTKQSHSTIMNCDIIRFIMSVLKTQEYKSASYTFEEERKLRNMLAKHLDQRFSDMSYNPKRTIRWYDDVISVKPAIVETAFALALKKIISALFDIDYNILLGIGEKHRKLRAEVLGIQYPRTAGLNCRQIMEYIADSVFKPEYGKQIWFGITMDWIRTHYSEADQVIISDLRYSEEYDGLLNLIRTGHAVMILQLVRPGVEPSGEYDFSKFNSHRVVNDSSIEELLKKIKQLCN